MGPRSTSADRNPTSCNSKQYANAARAVSCFIAVRSLDRRVRKRLSSARICLGSWQPGVVHTRIGCDFRRLSERILARTVPPAKTHRHHGGAHRASSPEETAGRGQPRGTASTGRDMPMRTGASIRQRMCRPNGGGAAGAPRRALHFSLDPWAVETPGGDAAGSHVSRWH